jgi:uncharacterized RDD family membrane protein YckC
MTQSPDHPQDQQASHEAVPPQQGAQPPMPPAQPYPSAPPISEAYGAPQAPGALADRWRRLVAAILDSLIIGVIAWLFIVPVLGGDAMTNNGIAERFASNGIIGVVAIIYFGLQHGKWGQSIGKRALGIRVVRAADSGPIGYGAAFGRVIFAHVFSILTFNIGALVDVAFVLWDSRKQALHDKVVKTVVVNADGPDPYAGA